MKKKCIIIGSVPAVLLSVVLLFILSLFLLKVLWSWVIPDIFPGAVANGLIARNISWFTSFKLAILIAILGGFIGGLKNKRD